MPSAVDYFLLVVSLVALALISPGTALVENDPCTNPLGQRGICIYARECQPIIDILKKKPATPQESNFVRNSKCGDSVAGSNTLVCCAGASVINRGPKEGLPKPPNCGVYIEDRIFGGQPTQLDEFPWTALIHYRKPNGNLGFHCGGSLINSRYVITAAHCINAIPRGWQVIGVRLGEYDLKNDDKDCSPDDEKNCADIPVDMAIDKIIVHENYNPQGKSQWDDIALIRFTRDVTYSTYVKPICLPLRDSERNRNNVGTTAVAAGWGRTETASASNIKLKVQLNIADFDRCSTVYKPSNVVLRDTQLCAGGKKGQDTCSGDSGGPLMKLIGANYFLYGIVSFGPNKCGTKDVPGVYTNVAKYTEWIENNLE